MTLNQAAVLRVKWKQRMDQTPCEHRALEGEWNDLGHSIKRNYKTISVLSVVNLWPRGT